MHLYCCLVAWTEVAALDLLPLPAAVKGPAARASRLHPALGPHLAPAKGAEELSSATPAALHVPGSGDKPGTGQPVQT